jgi:putative oxidoreductase
MSDARGQRYSYHDTSGVEHDTAALERDRDYRDRDYDETMAEPWRLGWNSGADLGLLVMRVILGGIFAAHGAQKVFGWWGGPGLDTFANNLKDLGFTQTDVLSAAVGFTELVGGVLVILGLFAPLATAGLLAVAVNAVWLRWGHGLFLINGGYEPDLALAGLAAGLTLTGPGRASLDNGRAWFRHPVATGWIFLLLGVAAVVVARIVFHGSL